MKKNIQRLVPPRAKARFPNPEDGSTVLLNNPEIANRTRLKIQPKNTNPQEVMPNRPKLDRQRSIDFPPFLLGAISLGYHALFNQPAVNSNAAVSFSHRSRDNKSRDEEERTKRDERRCGVTPDRLARSRASLGELRNYCRDNPFAPARVKTCSIPPCLGNRICELIRDVCGWSLKSDSWDDSCGKRSGTRDADDWSLLVNFFRCFIIIDTADFSVLIYPYYSRPSTHEPATYEQIRLMNNGLRRVAFVNRAPLRPISRDSIRVLE